MARGTPQMKCAGAAAAWGGPAVRRPAQRGTRVAGRTRATPAPGPASSPAPAQPAVPPRIAAVGVSPRHRTAMGPAIANWPSRRPARRWTAPGRSARRTAGIAATVLTAAIAPPTPAGRRRRREPTAARPRPAPPTNPVLRTSAWFAVAARPVPATVRRADPPPVTLREPACTQAPRPSAVYACAPVARTSYSRRLVTARGLASRGLFRPVRPISAIRSRTIALPPVPRLAEPAPPAASARAGSVPPRKMPARVALRHPRPLPTRPVSRTSVWEDTAASRVARPTR
jgi:hypothetical protein